MDFLIPDDLTIPEFLRREPPLSDYERDDMASEQQIKSARWIAERYKKGRLPRWSELDDMETEIFRQAFEELEQEKKKPKGDRDAGASA